MFGAAGDGAGAFFADLFFEGGFGGAGVHVYRLRWLGDDAFKGGCGDKFGFPTVPFCEDGGRWRTT